jgi:methylthioxylose transferase
MDTIDLAAARRPTGDGTRLSVGGAVVLGVEVCLVGAAIAAGALLNHDGVPLHADAAPLCARWLPHLGPGTPLCLIVAAVVVVRGPGWAARLPWRRLLACTYLGALAWTLALALVDGWSRGVARRLTPQAEYLHDIPAGGGIRGMLAGFSSHILDFQPPPPGQVP